MMKKRKKVNLHDTIFIVKKYLKKIKFAYFICEHRQHGGGEDR